MSNHNVNEDLHSLLVPIEGLHEDPDNNRDHSDPEGIQAIKDSYQVFGQQKPIVIDKASGKVIAGNGGLIAARELGWTHIAVVRNDDPEAMQIAFGIADNRTAELSKWNEANLAESMHLLADTPYIQKMGFDDEAIEKIKAEFDVKVGEMPELTPRADDALQQITFFFTEEQHELVKAAVERSKQVEPLTEEETGNPNTNGNALWAIAAAFMRQHEDG